MLSENLLVARQRLANGESPLMAALYRGHHDIVDAVIDAGAEIDVYAAAATGRMEDLRGATDRRDGQRLRLRRLDAASPGGVLRPLEAARVLLDAGADVHAVSRNSLTNTPLHAATAGKHEEWRCCFWKRAKSDAVDAGGYTPLQIATQNQLQAVVNG
jgi:ankyrin repeat protein